MKKRWVIAEPAPALTRSLVQALRLPEPLAQALVNRGFHEVEAAQQFLNPQLRQLSDPFELPDMAPAVDRILAAIRQKVLIVDLDPQGNASSGLGIDYKNLNKGMYEVLVDENTKITEVIKWWFRWRKSTGLQFSN